MTISRDIIAGSISVGAVVGVIISWHFFKWVLIALWSYTQRLFIPLESKLLRFLQERAMARALGVDVDIIRARRKIESLHQ